MRKIFPTKSYYYYKGFLKGWITLQSDKKINADTGETQSKDRQSSHKKNYKWQIKEFLKVQPTHNQRNAN